MQLKSQKFLLGLARQTLIDYFKLGKKIELSDEQLPTEELKRQAATFVTITKNNELRGCVGRLISKKSIHQDVVDNALLAGFGDSRFVPIKQEELSEIKIEISVLSKSQPYLYENSDQLRKLIQPHVHGIIVQKDFYQATFLPQVWQELPDLDSFMSALCQKAGLPKEAWLEPETEIFYYTVETFSE